MAVPPSRTPRVLGAGGSGERQGQGRVVLAGIDSVRAQDGQVLLVVLDAAATAAANSVPAAVILSVLLLGNGEGSTAASTRTGS